MRREQPQFNERRVLIDGVGILCEAISDLLKAH